MVHPPHSPAPEDSITHIYVTMASTGEPYTVSRTRYAAHYHKCQRYTKKHPLALAYAMTVHRAQGATLPNGAILWLREAFMAGCI